MMSVLNFFSSILLWVFSLSNRRIIYITRFLFYFIIINISFGISFVLKEWPIASDLNYLLLIRAFLILNCVHFSFFCFSNYYMHSVREFGLFEIIHSFYYTIEISLTCLPFFYVIMRAGAFSLVTLLIFSFVATVLINIARIFVLFTWESFKNYVAIGQDMTGKNPG